MAEFETKLDEVKAAVVKNKEPEKVSEEEIFQKMAEMIDDDDGNFKLKSRYLHSKSLKSLNRFLNPTAKENSTFL